MYDKVPESLVREFGEFATNEVLTLGSTIESILDLSNHSLAKGHDQLEVILLRSHAIEVAIISAQVKALQAISKVFDHNCTHADSVTIVTSLFFSYYQILCITAFGFRSPNDLLKNLESPEHFTEHYKRFVALFTTDTLFLKLTEHVSFEGLHEAFCETLRKVSSSAGPNYGPY